MAGLAPPAPPPALTRDQTLAALREVSVLVSNPAVAAQLDAVKAAAGADAMMALMMVMPLAVQLLTPILTTYGYAPDQGGLMQFVAAGSAYKDDEEIVRLGLEMRAQLIPPVMLPMVQAMMAGMPQAPPA